MKHVPNVEAIPPERCVRSNWKSKGVQGKARESKGKRRKGKVKGERARLFRESKGKLGRARESKGKAVKKWNGGWCPFKLNGWAVQIEWGSGLTHSN